MSKRFDVQNLGERLYETLPRYYRAKDDDNKESLRRYLYALVDGGIGVAAKEADGILDIVDPMNTPEAALPILAKQFGFDLFNGIPVLYSRKLVQTLGDMYARKGCVDVLEYIAGVVADVKVVVHESSGLDTQKLNGTNLNDTFKLVGDEWEKRFSMELVVEMDWDRPESLHDLPDVDMMKRIAKDFVPFFVDVTIVYSFIYVEGASIRATEGGDQYSLYETTSDAGKLSVSEVVSSSAKLEVEEEVLESRVSAHMNRAYLNNDFFLGATPQVLGAWDVLDSTGMDTTEPDSTGIGVSEGVLDSASTTYSYSPVVSVSDSYEESFTYPAQDSLSLGFPASLEDYSGTFLGITFRLNSSALVVPDVVDVLTYPGGVVRYGYPAKDGYIILEST